MSERTERLARVAALADATRAHETTRAERNAAMSEAYAAGCILSEIAEAAGLSTNGVSLALGRPAGGRRHSPASAAAS